MVKSRVVWERKPYFVWRHTVENLEYGSQMNGMHYDPCMIITFLIRGTGLIYVEGISHTINEGDLLILNSREFHRCFFNKCQEHERISIYIHDEFSSLFAIPPEQLFSAFCDRTPGYGNIISAKILESLEIDRLLREIATKPAPIESDEDATVIMTCKIVEVMLLLKKAFQNSQNTSVYSTGDKTVSKIIEYIKKDLQADLSTATVASEFFLDKSYLCRVFKHATGATLGEYVTRKRIDYAIELMAAGKTCIEACFESGFGNYSSFYKAFRMHTGKDPNGYKNTSNK